MTREDRIIDAWAVALTGLFFRQIQPHEFAYWLGWVTLFASLLLGIIKFERLKQAYDTARAEWEKLK